MEKIAVSLAEAEEITSVSRYTLRRQIARGTLKVARIGRRLVISMAELERFIRRAEKSGSSFDDRENAASVD